MCLFLGIGASVLLGMLGDAGRVQAQPFRGGFHQGFRPTFTPGFRGGFLPGSRFTPGFRFDSRFRGGMFDRGFDRRFRGGFFDRDFDRRFRGGSFGRRFRDELLEPPFRFGF
jgi:hypothetical protein